MTGAHVLTARQPAAVNTQADDTMFRPTRCNDDDLDEGVEKVVKALIVSFRILVTRLEAYQLSF